MDYCYSFICNWIQYFSLRNIVVEPSSELRTIGRSPSESTNSATTAKIEDYRPGYPRFSALIAADDFFFAFRSFRRLRARLLLLKQDKLSLLEQQLDQVDREETFPLFLGKSRCDRNQARSALVCQIETCLSEYDQLAQKTQEALKCNLAKPRDVQSLQNWVEGSGCLDRDETEYLEKDLISLSSSQDSATKQLEDWIEDQMISYCTLFRRGCGFEVSEDENVYLYHGTFIKRTAQALMLSLVAILLLTPVAICIALPDVSARLVVIILSIITWLAVLAHMTNAKMMELILAGASFATILTVFLTNSTYNSGVGTVAAGSPSFTTAYNS